VGRLCALRAVAHTTLLDDWSATILQLLSLRIARFVEKKSLGVDYNGTRTNPSISTRALRLIRALVTLHAPFLSSALAPTRSVPEG